jgi:hypothetical protein
MEICCGTCFYGRDNSPGVVSCYRYPPTITKAEGTTVTSYFPLLTSDAWCGEWKRKKPGYGRVQNARSHTKS